MVDFKENEQLNTLNHSCAHVMAQAIKHLYPQAKFWVGPVVSEGFYYDVDLGDEVVSDEAIAKIEKEMKKICKDGKRIVRREISKEEALEMFKDDEYKLDLISNLEDGTITCYSQGDFTDLCRGPHVETVKMCKNFKLIKHSGAYWKGDSKNKMLQRIYAISFPKASLLEEHLAKLEEAKQRIANGEKYVVRQTIPSTGITSFEDEVYGHIEVENAGLAEGVLLKSDGYPTYNFANIVDDHLMNITHVVRGNEYLSSTPKYNLIYQAFGWDVPSYIHCPPVMKDEKHKLSKRNGDASYQDLI